MVRFKRSSTAIAKICMNGEIGFVRGHPGFVGGLPQPLSVVVFTPPITACAGQSELPASRTFVTLGITG